MAEQPTDPEGRPPPTQRPEQRQPSLKCPFCSGKRFDFGRDIYAGPDQVMYCRKSPAPGERPDGELSLRMKGAVCLDCGYVAMMVSLEDLRAPIRRAAGAAASGGFTPEEEAVKALEEMTGSGGGPRDVAEALEEIRRAEDGFGDLGALLDDAERRENRRDGEAGNRGG